MLISGPPPSLIHSFLTNMCTLQSLSSYFTGTQETLKRQDHRHIGLLKSYGKGGYFHITFMRITSSSAPYPFRIMATILAMVSLLRVSLNSSVADLKVQFLRFSDQEILLLPTPLFPGILPVQQTAVSVFIPHNVTEVLELSYF